MFNFSMPELVLILGIALVVFGPGKLPEVGKAVGKGLNEFRRAMNDKDQPVNITPKNTESVTEEKNQEVKKSHE
ncbi:MAG: tatA [Firmicutes bacterium]|nr:tatA [Bacillota bacterium]